MAVRNGPHKGGEFRNLPMYRSYYSDIDFQMMGPSSSCGGAAPQNNYLGSYVPPQYLLPDCPSTMIYHRGNSAVCAGALGAMSSSARGLESGRLMPEGQTMGCYDAFKSFLIDPPRDVLAADRLDSDPDGVLSIRRGQSHDLRGDIPIGQSAPFGGCGTNQANCYTMDPGRAVLGYKDWDSNMPWGIMQGTQTGNDFWIGNKIKRTFVY